MRLNSLIAKTYREANKQALRVAGEFLLRDDANISKKFTYKGQRYISNGCWYLDIYSIVGKKTKIPLSNLVPKNMFEEILLGVEKLLNETIRPKYTVDCNLQIGDGENEICFRSVGEDVEIKGNLTIKNKGNMKLTRSNMKITKGLKDKNKKEQAKMNKGKEMVLSVIASLPYAGGAVRQYDVIQLDKRFSAVDSKMEDLYLKVEESSGESQKRAIIDAIGQMKLLAGTGSIDVEGSLLEALNRITVNSQQGTIFIDGTRIAASQIRLSSETGGETTLTNTVSESKGTKIDIGKKAQIKIKGNAKIDQN